MERDTRSQLELFSQAPTAGKAQKSSPKSFFFAQLRLHEKTVLLIFAFIITGIVFFALGVEKGKRTIFAKQQGSYKLTGKKTFTKEAEPKAEPVVTEVKGEVLEKKERVPAETQKQENLDNYVIQLASYNSREHAEREAEHLKKMGFSPLILAKGKYIVLYVGKYPSRENANSVLPQLRKRYKDCLIRRL